MISFKLLANFGVVRKVGRCLGNSYFIDVPVKRGTITCKVKKPKYLKTGSECASRDPDENRLKSVRVVSINETTHLNVLEFDATARELYVMYYRNGKADPIGTIIGLYVCQKPTLVAKSSRVNLMNDSQRDQVFKGPNSFDRKGGRYDYVGEIQNYNPHGKGIFQHYGQSYTYKGEFKKGKYHGNGQLKVQTPFSEYYGDFINGMYHGDGSLTNNNGFFKGSFYKGEFCKGIFKGKVSIQIKIQKDNYEVYQEGVLIQAIARKFPEKGLVGFCAILSDFLILISKSLRLQYL